VESSGPGRNKESMEARAAAGVGARLGPGDKAAGNGPLKCFICEASTCDLASAGHDLNSGPLTRSTRTSRPSDGPRPPPPSPRRLLSILIFICTAFYRRETAHYCLGHGFFHSAAVMDSAGRNFPRLDSCARTTAAIFLLDLGS
jgi:hypothetical protein